MPDNNKTTVWVEFNLTPHEVSSLYSAYKPEDIDLHSIYRNNLPTSTGNPPHPEECVIEWEPSDNTPDSVTYIAELTKEQYEYFDGCWSLGDAEEAQASETEPGCVDFLFDGMDWNVGGITPFTHVRVTVQEA